jgi:hypothetical protein
VAHQGSSVKFAGIPTEPLACVAASGCASQQENATAFMKNRIVRFSAVVRTHWWVSSPDAETKNRIEHHEAH